jgi:transcriptional regulator with XRE-family HTH domain
MAHQFKNVVGPHVACFRNRHGWSQSAFAAKCQIAGWPVSRGIIAAIEGRVRWVGDFELAMLARVLKVDVRDLLPKVIDPSLFEQDEE